VRAFMLLEALLVGECDAERPPRNENVGSSIARPTGQNHPATVIRVQVRDACPPTDS
jgi:hypothetical protein